MTAFPLRIVTPDGMEYEGHAEEAILRTTSGDLGILAGHVDCVAPLGMGRATFIIDGQKRYAACIGGLLSMSKGTLTLVPTTFEWADDIDRDRAERAAERAQAVLESKAAGKTDLLMAEAKLKRALVRKGVADLKTR
jgi:F-type H+-transporting ATPase subunit epsilon